MRNARFLIACCLSLLACPLACGAETPRCGSPKHTDPRRERQARRAGLAAHARPPGRRQLPLAVDRGLLLEAVRARGRDARHHGEHRSAGEVPHRDLPHRLLRRPRRAADDHPGAVSGDGAAHPARRRQAAARMPLDALHDAEDSRRLAERRVPGPADHDSRGGRPAVLAELRHLHRPRHAPRRRAVPVQRQHLAGLQPLARQRFAVHRPARRPRPRRGRQLRPALRPPVAIHRHRQRPALGRLRRVPVLRAAAGLLPGGARL